MKATRRQAFYLAFFALFSGSCAAKGSQTAHSPDVCAFEPKAKVSDACASYADLDTLNNRLYPSIRNLANNTDFFSYYRLNLYNKKCPFWDDESGTCGNSACAVTTLENEEDIPSIWRAEELSRLEGPKAHHPGRQQQRLQRPLSGELGADVEENCVVEFDDECDDRDYCIPEDESSGGKGDYVSLVDNPERFTGYGGESAHQIWEAIYRENCFSRPGEVTPFSNNQALAANDFKQILARQPQATDDAECLEKRVFYRIVSGMHASISTHLCDQYLNQTTGEWAPNLQCYKERLHDYPERISNLYFNYALVLRAVGKLKDCVQDYTFCTGDSAQDRKTRSMMSKLASTIPAGPQIFDESVMFQDNTLSGIELKEDFRNRFRNISRVMDCVGCDKCRLWGKLQTNGLGTALKVLFEFGGEHASQDHTLLRRTELVALVNTLDKISSALKALERFRDQMAAERSSIDGDAGTTGFEDLEDASWEQTDLPVESLSDVFWEELSLVWRAYVFVLRSWLEAPRKLLDISIMEGYRLFSFWIGKPVPERSWEIRIPKHDEL